MSAFARSCPLTARAIEGGALDAEILLYYHDQHYSATSLFRAAEALAGSLEEDVDLSWREEARRSRWELAEAVTERWCEIRGRR